MGFILVTTSKSNGGVVLVIGSGRSGTTWVHEALTRHWNTRPIFEPLHPLQVQGADRFAGRFLEASDRDDALKHYLDLVFHRRTRSAWIRWLHMGISKGTPLPRAMAQFVYNLPSVRPWARLRVVKFIEANLMIPWLLEVFDYPVVFVLRNPHAVVASQRAMGWRSKLDRYLSQEQLVDIHLSKQLEMLQGIDTEIERLAAIWCIQNKVALSWVGRRPDRIYPVCFEDLKSDPGRIDRLMSDLGMPSHVIGFNRSYMRVRQRVRGSSRRKTRGARLSDSERGAIDRVLASFGMREYPEVQRRLRGDP